MAWEGDWSYVWVCVLFFSSSLLRFFHVSSFLFSYESSRVRILMNEQIGVISCIRNRSYRVVFVRTSVNRRGDRGRGEEAGGGEGEGWWEDWCLEESGWVGEEVRLSEER